MKLEYLHDGSPDCPLIRLYDFNRVEMLRVREAFSALASRSQADVPLHEMKGVEAVDGCELHLRIGQHDQGIIKKGLLKFDCVLTPNRWSNVEHLAEPFVEDANLTGYQWLNEDSDISLLLSPSGSW